MDDGTATMTTSTIGPDSALPRGRPVRRVPMPGRHSTPPSVELELAASPLLALAAAPLLALAAAPFLALAIAAEIQAVDGQPGTVAPLPPGTHPLTRTSRLGAADASIALTLTAVSVHACIALALTQSARSNSMRFKQ